MPWDQKDDPGASLLSGALEWEGKSWDRQIVFVRFIKQSIFPYKSGKTHLGGYAPKPLTETYGCIRMYERR